MAEVQVPRLAQEGAAALLQSWICVGLIWNSSSEQEAHTPDLVIKILSVHPTESPQHCLGSEEVPTQGGPGAHLSTGVVATDCLLLPTPAHPRSFLHPHSSSALDLWACGHVYVLVASA